MPTSTVSLGPIVVVTLEGGWQPPQVAGVPCIMLFKPLICDLGSFHFRIGGCWNTIFALPTR